MTTLEEADVEDAPYLYNQCVTRLGRAGGVLLNGPDSHLFYSLLVRKKVSGIGLLRLFLDLRSSLASAKL